MNLCDNLFCIQDRCLEDIHLEKIFGVYRSLRSYYFSVQGYQSGGCVTWVNRIATPFHTAPKYGMVSIVSFDGVASPTPFSEAREPIVRISIIPASYILTDIPAKGPH